MVYVLPAIKFMDCLCVVVYSSIPCWVTSLLAPVLATIKTISLEALWENVARGLQKWWTMYRTSGALLIFKWGLEAFLGVDSDSEGLISSAGLHCNHNDLHTVLLHLDPLITCLCLHLWVKPGPGHQWHLIMVNINWLCLMHPQTGIFILCMNNEKVAGCHFWHV